MKLGIIGAMDVEVALLKEKMQVKQTVTRAGMEFSEGTIGKTDVVVVKSGVGKVNAGCCVQILADCFQVTHILNTGAAGSLNNNVHIGDIVVSTDAVYHDVDATVFGYRKGEVPQMGIFSFPADKELRTIAVKSVREAAPGISVFEGRVASGDQFVADKDVKAQIIADCGGFCTEMEGAAIAQASYINGIPFVIIRAISDQADESVKIAYEEFETKAAKDCAAAVLYFVEHI